jgi:hypothetical protein
MHWRSVFVRKDPALHIKSLAICKRLLLFFHSEPLQFGGEFRTHIDLALRCLSFGRFHMAMVWNIPADNNVVPLEINVVPLNRRSLAVPPAGPSQVFPYSAIL